MLKERDAVIRKALAIFDAFVVCIAFLVAFSIRTHFHDFYKIDLLPGSPVIADASALSFSDYLVVLFFVVPIWCVSLYFCGIYNRWRTKAVSDIIFMIIKATFLTAISFGTVTFLFKLKFVSRAFFILFLVVSVIMIVIEKVSLFYTMQYVRKLGHNIRRLLIVGSGNRAAQFIRLIHGHKEWGFRIVGAIDYDEEHRGKEIDSTGENVIGMLEDMPRILQKYSIDEVIFVVPRSKLNLIENSLYTCETYGVKATLAADIFELKVAKARQTELEGMPLITFETTPTQEWQLFLKRAFDIVASGVLLLVLSPLFLAVAALIKITSPGPVLFRQERSGMNGRKFVLYKFRSMQKGAHLKVAELSGSNEMEGPVFKMRNDPRVTPIGKFLRKFSIDELPQLINVFIGQMSLVGPRPPLPKEVKDYEPWQRRRLSMRPGITCLWQVSGRNKIGFDEWMKLDLQYIDSWSLWLDFKILAKTVPVVLFGIGAY